MTVPLPLTALAGAAAVAGWAWWALAPARHVPRFRVWSMRMRLRLRVHPVTGTASLAALQWHWSRWACWRRSRLARSSMPWWARALQPAAHSIFLGRAQHRHGVRVPVEEHVLLLAPPRSGKTGALTAIVQTYPGPVVMTSTKADVISLTGAARALGGPVWVFNPMRIGGVPSNLRWDPVAGCQDPATAIRRADAFASAVNVRGTEDPSFWSSKAAGWLRALFCAAALDGGGMRTVAAWALGSAERAEQILEAHGHGQWAVELAELRGEAQKTVATVRMVLARALQFLNSPQLAECVEPAAGDNVLDPAGFLSSRATLYMLSDHAGDDAPLAPLYAAMIAELHYIAQLTGSSMPAGRLDPPLLLALDEVCQVAPVPLPDWMADSGGKGIQIIAVTHGEGQLADRYREYGARAITDCASALVYLPGITDVTTLEAASKLCGQVSLREPGQDRPSRVDVLTPDMIRQLPPGWALVIRGGLAPVITRLPRGWKTRAYRAASRRGRLSPAQNPDRRQPPPPPAAPDPSADGQARGGTRPLALIPDADYEPGISGSEPWS